MYKTVILFVWVSIASGQVIMKDAPGDLKKIDVIEHLGENIPLGLDFTDSSGETVQLGDFFNQEKPVLLTLAYYECPMLCTFVLNGLSEGVAALSFLPGEDFQMVTVSIDPEETSRLAAAKKKNQISAIGKEVPADGWAFLVGSRENIDSLAGAVGFVYYYDESRDEYAHPAVSYILTSGGRISRYLYGMQFPEKDLRFALLEASEGKIGSTLDRLLLYCYHYDPDAKGYVVFAGNVMKIGGVITVLVLGIVLLVLWRRDVFRTTS